MVVAVLFVVVIAVVLAIVVPVAMVVLTVVLYMLPVAVIVAGSVALVLIGQRVRDRLVGGDGPGEAVTTGSVPEAWTGTDTIEPADTPAADANGPDWDTADGDETVWLGREAYFSRSYRRTRAAAAFSLGAPIVGFVLGGVVLVVGGTEPFGSWIGTVFVLALRVSVPAAWTVFSLYAGRDKRELRARTGRSTPRHPVWIAVVTSLTIGLYPFYYLYRRWRTFHVVSDADRAASLDEAMGRVDFELLERFGASTRHRRAGHATDDGRWVLEVPDDPDEYRNWYAYYRQVGAFTDEFGTAAGMRPSQSSSGRQLVDLIDGYSPRHTSPQADSDHIPSAPLEAAWVVYACRRLWIACSGLADVDDDTGLRDLAARLSEVPRPPSTVDGAPSDGVLDRLVDVERWAGERLQFAQVVARRERLRDAWSDRVTPRFGLAPAATPVLANERFPRGTSVETAERTLAAAERVVRLADTIDRPGDSAGRGVPDGLPAVLEAYLAASTDQPSAAGNGTGTPGRLLEIVEAVTATHRKFPSYPFDRLVAQILAEPDPDEARLDGAETLLHDAETVLTFLSEVDHDHPSVRATEWQRTVRTALETHRPMDVRPVAALIRRMRDTLWERTHLYEFTFEEFEHLVAKLFAARGYTTTVTRLGSDGGVDVWARSDTDGTRVAIQIKQFATGNRVGRPTLQRIVSTIAKGDADRAIVVTSGTFATTATEYAAEFGDRLELIDGDGLVKLLSESTVPPPLGRPALPSR